MAVYTHIDDRMLGDLLAGFDIGRALSFKGIAEGVENSNYFLETETGRFILTLYEKRVSAGDLPYCLGLMDHLSARDLPVPKPVADRGGRVLQELAGRPAAIIGFLDGISIAETTPPHCTAVGASLARLHRAGADFTLRRTNDLSLDGWHALAEKTLTRADEVEPGLARFIEEELRFLHDHWPDGLPVGTIHADLFPDNVLFTGNTVTGLIDFYFACTDMLAYDVAGWNRRNWTPCRCWRAAVHGDFCRPACTTGCFPSRAPWSARRTRASIWRASDITAPSGMPPIMSSDTGKTPHRAGLGRRHRFPWPRPGIMS